MYKLDVFHIGLNITSNSDLHVIQITLPSMCPRDGATFILEQNQSKSFLL